MEGTQYRARTGAIQVPAALVGSIEAVLGLDNRPHVKPHFRLHGANAPKAKAPKSISYTPRQVAQLYQFPLDVDGTGQGIGILELGGGYRPADLKTYFSSVGVNEPKVTAVLVDNAKNKPTNPNGADGEVLLDIEVAGSVAPGAAIAVYFAPNTTSGFQDALTTAIHVHHEQAFGDSPSAGADRNPPGRRRPQTAMDSAAQDAAPSLG